MPVRTELNANIITALILLVVVLAAVLFIPDYKHKDKDEQKPVQLKSYLVGRAEKELVTVEHRGHLYVILYGPKTNELMHSPECTCQKEKK